MLNKATGALSKIMRSKKIIVVSSNGKRLEYIPPVVIEPPDFGPTGLIWTTIEQITIDEDFKYYNSELTGNPKVDLQLIYGSKDVHNSIGILTRPSEDNIARIKRNYDISLTKCDDTYLINNGRHRIVYLKHYFADCYQYCDTEEALNTLKQKVTIPVRINKRLEDRRINEILIFLKEKYEDMFIFKTDVLNDNPELAIFYEDSLYYVKNKDEIIDFYQRIELGEDLTEYKLLNLEPVTYPDINRVFEELHNIYGNHIYELSYIGLIRLLKLTPLYIDGISIKVEQLPLKKLYFKYLDMTTCYMICNTYDIDLPEDTSFQYSKFSKEHKIGIYLMQIINQHLEYKEYTWEQIFAILHEDPKLSQYDSDYLKDIAMEHGIRELLGDQIFVKRKKK
jgi:hypothetical protein